MRKRKFKIIRKPELRGSSFLFNSVEVRYVTTCPETGISFYVNNGKGSVIGVRVYPDGRKVLVSPDKADSVRKHGKAVYLQFRNAFGSDKYITASHAVYIAWNDKEIPDDMTIDHIDGCTTNNDHRNLRCVSNEINNRDGGFLRKLRNQGIKPTTIQRWMLLRYYDRMATIKASIKEWRYDTLTKGQLTHILYDADEDFSIMSIIPSLKH